MIRGAVLAVATTVYCVDHCCDGVWYKWLLYLCVLSWEFLFRFVCLFVHIEHFKFPSTFPIVSGWCVFALSRSVWKTICLTHSSHFTAAFKWFSIDIIVFVIKFLFAEVHSWFCDLYWTSSTSPRFFCSLLGLIGCLKKICIIFFQCIHNTK